VLRPRPKPERGAAYGAAGGAVAGAVLGQAIGRDTKGTLIGAAAGAAVGAAAGAGVGQMMDRQEAEMRDALAASEAAAVRREGDLLAITLKGDVSFDLDSDVVRPGLYNELDRIAEIMIKYPQTSIQVEGPHGQYRIGNI
jgi:outer membrane protein OmpA-like peptidoglycan-associated protein